MYQKGKMRKKFLAVMLACSFVSTAFYQPNAQPTALAAAGLERVVSVSGVRTSGTSATIRFAKVKKASGYQVVYATNKTFSANKRSKKTTKTTVRLLSLKSKKTYYVKVRGFRTKKGKISYGAYSKVLVLQNLSTPQVTPTIVPNVSGTPAATPAQASSTPSVVTTPAVSSTPDVTASVKPTMEVTPKVTVSVKPTMEATPKATASAKPTMEVTPEVAVTVEPTMEVTPKVTAKVEATMNPTPEITTTVEPSAEVTPTIAPTTEPTAVIEPTTKPTPDPEGIVYKDDIHKATHEKIEELSDKAIISDSVLGYTEIHSFEPPEDDFVPKILTSVKDYEEFRESTSFSNFDLKEDFLNRAEKQVASGTRLTANEYFDEDFFKEYNLVFVKVTNIYDTDGDVCVHEAYIKDNELHIPILFAYYEETTVKYHMNCYYHVYAVGKNIVTAYGDVQEKIYPGKAPNSSDEIIVEKPIIYLYPEKEQEISVSFAHPEDLTITYPKYKDSWNVMARPDGTLTDLSTGRELYSLYYECRNCIPGVDFSEGFVVKGEDSAAFLEEKLEILGLNYKEAEEFIVYWLPRLEANPYNYIRFADKEEIDQLIPLTVSGNPDTMIRVLMEYMPLEQEISVKEQTLTPVERSGFTVVEWGGTCLEK